MRIVDLLQVTSTFTLDGEKLVQAEKGKNGGKVGREENRVYCIPSGLSHRALGGGIEADCR